MLGGQVNDELLVRLARVAKATTSASARCLTAPSNARPRSTNVSHFDKLGLETESRRPVSTASTSRSSRATHVAEDRESTGLPGSSFLSSSTRFGS